MFGIPSLIAKQMTQRITLEPTKGEHGLIFQVEPKKEFKKRLGYAKRWAKRAVLRSGCRYQAQQAVGQIRSTRSIRWSMTWCDPRPTLRALSALWPRGISVNPWIYKWTDGP